MKRILVTGGLGYIGSHTCVALIEAGYKPVVIDNLRNTRIETKKAIEEITGELLEFYELDAKNSNEVSFKIGPIDGTIHFAALKSIGESIEKPMKYYTENLESLLSIIEVSSKNGAKKFYLFLKCYSIWRNIRGMCYRRNSARYTLKSIWTYQVPWRTNIKIWQIPFQHHFT